MQRLVIRAIEEFLRDTYGEGLWGRVKSACDLEPVPSTNNAPGSSAHGRSQRAERLIPVAASLLGKPPEELSEDLGAWLARREPIRRLLRFSGRDFGDFVMSLEELPGRAHFVIPDLDIPRIDVVPESRNSMQLVLPETKVAWTAVLGGLLRAMADDYGALGLIAVEGNTISIDISAEDFAEARDFQLGSVPSRSTQRVS